MAETLSPDDVGLQLFENAAATAGALVGLIVMVATVSGAHGAVLANAMFSEQTGEGLIFFSTQQRNGGPELLSEIIATIGLHGAHRATVDACSACFRWRRIRRPSDVLCTSSAPS